MTDQPKTCRTCGHWVADAGTRRDLKDWSHDLEWSLKNGWLDGRCQELELRFLETLDGCIPFDAAIRTDPNFSCALWEAKEAPCRE